MNEAEYIKAVAEVLSWLKQGLLTQHHACNELVTLASRYLQYLHTSK